MGSTFSEDPGALEEEDYEVPKHEGHFYTGPDSTPVLDIFEEVGIRVCPSTSGQVQKWLNKDERPVLTDATNTISMDNVNTTFKNMSISTKRGRRGKNHANKNKNRREASNASRHLNNLNRLRDSTEFRQSRIPPTELSSELEAEYASIISSIESKKSLGQTELFEPLKPLSGKVSITQMMTLTRGRWIDSFVLYEYLQLVFKDAQRKYNIKLSPFGVYNALCIRDFDRAVS